MQASKPITLGVSLFLAALLQPYGGTAGGQDVAGGDGISIKGTIKKVTASETTGKLVGDILVDVDGKGKYSFFLRKETQIMRGNNKIAKWADLKVDQRVTVTYNGIVSPARPPHVVADRIVIDSQPDSEKQQ